MKNLVVILAVAVALLVGLIFSTTSTADRGAGKGGDNHKPD